MRLPDTANDVELPPGWSIDESAPVATLIGPEGDLRVTFLATPLDGAPADVATSAWRSLDPSFELPLISDVEMAAAGGWDGSHQFVFATPAAESSVAVTLLRTLGKRAYLAMVTGSKAGLNRRMAQLGELLEAWRPEGLVDVDLNARDALAWGAEQTAALSTFIDSAMRELHVPGMSIAIVQDGRIVCAAGFGVTSLADGRPVDADTRYMIGSTTKSLTTLMMARLVEDGSFAWTTPLTSVLPGFALADPDVTAKLEMRHTVAACTGMPRRDLDLLFHFKNVTAEDRMAEMRAMTPTTDFGETFQYSNYLVAAGGYAAAHAYAPDAPLEAAYERAMRELVFEPLGMEATTLPPRAPSESHAAAPHALDLAGECVVVDVAIEGFADAVAPAGAAWSSVNDMARYVMLELSGGTLSGDRRLVSRKALDSRREQQIKIDGKSGYGLGLFLTRKFGIELIGHGGNTMGFTSDLFFLPGKNLGVATLCNQRAANLFLAAVRQRIFELVFDAPQTAEQMVGANVRSTEKAVESAKARIATDAESVSWLERFLGSYTSPELGSARIHCENGQYRAEFDSWGSALGVEMQADGERLIVLTSAPMAGVRLQPTADGNELLIDAAQVKYAFVKV
jgi:CubicO group peptidase (beta-lactamase class C family)